MRLIDSEVSTTVAVKVKANNTAMPDLQYAAARNDTMVDIRDHIMPMRCKHIQDETDNSPDKKQIAN
jgi:hypothetical protein